MGSTEKRLELETTDFIELQNMEFAGFLGVTEEERSRPQPLFIDLKMFLDLTAASERDRIRDTVNYQRAQKLIGDCVYQKQHILLESIGGEIVRLLFEHFPKIQAVDLKVKKPHALRNTDFTAVRLVRFR